MQTALASAIGLPRRSTSASWMLAFVMPIEVRRNLMLPPEVITAGQKFLGLTDPYAVETGRPLKTHRLRSDPASRHQGTFPHAAARESPELQESTAPLRKAGARAP